MSNILSVVPFPYRPLVTDAVPVVIDGKEFLKVTFELKKGDSETLVKRMTTFKSTGSFFSRGKKPFFEYGFEQASSTMFAEGLKKALDLKDGNTGSANVISARFEVESITVLLHMHDFVVFAVWGFTPRRVGVTFSDGGEVAVINPHVSFIVENVTSEYYDVDDDGNLSAFTDELPIGFELPEELSLIF